jgi:CBS domain-containing protein
MQAKDVMTKGVISVTPDTSVLRTVQLMLQYDLSGFPVIGEGGKLVGIVTEGDFLRRVETGTELHQESRPGQPMDTTGLADQYVRARARKVGHVMSRDVVTVTEDAPLSEVVGLMEARHIRRVPVMRGDGVVGIVSRRDLLHALVVCSQPAAPLPDSTDEAIRARIETEIGQQAWVATGSIGVGVMHGTVELWGSIVDERQRRALRVLVENVPGVTELRDKLILAESNFPLGAIGRV